MSWVATYEAVDAATGAVSRCPGPAADGSCPRVAVGEAVACAGCTLARVGADGGYPVPRIMTLCPVTLAEALAVPVETGLIPTEPVAVSA